MKTKKDKLIEILLLRNAIAGNDSVFIQKGMKKVFEGMSVFSLESFVNKKYEGEK